MAFSLQDFLVGAIDRSYALRPRPFPGNERLKRCRIISHRGEHDNRRVNENTLDAFERAERAGVWGIELDIRWTRDLCPVVFHDPDTSRIFGVPQRIRDMDADTLRREFPLIPHLSEVVNRFGKRLHLMVEIKAEPYPDPAFQNRVLEEIFSPLTVKTDYHLLSLSPRMLDRMEFAPPDTLVPIAETNTRRLSRLALQRNYRGLTGHYLLLRSGLVNAHRRRGQAVGTGFVNSRYCLYREVKRGVDWIFSDRAAHLQRICRRP